MYIVTKLLCNYECFCAKYATVAEYIQELHISVSMYMYNVILLLYILIVAFYYGKLCTFIDRTVVIS